MCSEMGPPLHVSRSVSLLQALRHAVCPYYRLFFVLFMFPREKSRSVVNSGDTGSEISDLVSIGYRDLFPWK
jgi:hypothetical protein